MSGDLSKYRKWDYDLQQKSLEYNPWLKNYGYDNYTNYPMNE